MCNVYAQTLKLKLKPEVAAMWRCSVGLFIGLSNYEVLYMIPVVEPLHPASRMA